MVTSEKSAWADLSEHWKKIASIHIRQLFENDNKRFNRFSLTFGDLFLDYSKNRIVTETFNLLIRLAKEQRVEEKRNAMFSAEKINITEDRPAFHVALRGSGSKIFCKETKDGMSKVERFVNDILNGTWKGSSGEEITEVINIGIGGSRLGPEMVIKSLPSYYQSKLRVHFVSNVDGHDLSKILSNVIASKTLFLIASKTFTTQETMTNSISAKAWIVEQLGEQAITKHFAAISSNTVAAKQFGISENSIFPMWEWVGGRYSLWSAIGLSIALQIGMENFQNLIQGGHEMDLHFCQAAITENLPIILALIGIWNINFENHNALAILPYDQRLELFPAFIQQLDMESNGKSVSLSGNTLDFSTGPVIFGEPGTNGQHAFYQSLHQGFNPIPADFLIVSKPDHALKGHHEQLVANALAQTRALMHGRTLEEANGNPHRKFSGNRPTNTILMRSLDPSTLGKLIALYEHKIFVQGIIWNINSFDQWGVELGKEMADDLLAKRLNSLASCKHDSSTVGLLKKIEKWQD